MKNALHRVELHKFANERIKTDEGDIIRIDNNGKITRSEFEPKMYRSKYMSWYDDSSYYNIHEEMLLTYCNCELLLEYGYSCDEIEEMLMDTNRLHEALRDVKYMLGEDVYESYCGAF